MCKVCWLVGNVAQKRARIARRRVKKKRGNDITANGDRHKRISKCVFAYRFQLFVITMRAFKRLFKQNDLMCIKRRIGRSFHLVSPCSHLFSLPGFGSLCIRFEFDVVVFFRKDFIIIFHLNEMISPDSVTRFLSPSLIPLLRARTTTTATHKCSMFFWCKKMAKAKQCDFKTISTKRKCVRTMKSRTSQMQRKCVLGCVEPNCWWCWHIVQTKFPNRLDCVSHCELAIGRDKWVEEVF